MAFGFFRRRQKMVMIIMVALMVSFLIGFQGFSSLFSHDMAKQPRGKTSYGTIRVGDLQQAASDMSWLNYILANENIQAPTTQEFMVLRNIQPEDERMLAYALLVQEAQEHKVRANDDDVSAFLAELRPPLTGQDYTGYIQSLHSQSKNFSESAFRAAIARWLTIHRMFTTCLTMTPPSEREISFLARDFFEKINLRVLEFPADSFMEKVPAITDSNVLGAQFRKFANARPGFFSDENPFGFGYHLPPRAQVCYAFIQRDVIERACRPSRQEADDYFVTHRSDFTRTTRPSTSSAPAAEANRLVQVLMSASEARPEIIRQLSEQNAAIRIEDTVNRFKKLLAEDPTGTATSGAYELALSKMVLKQEANAALDAKVDCATVGAGRLDAVVDRLAEKARLKTIVFPWGKHDDKNLDPAIQVKLEGGMTLRDALAQLCKQAQWPAVEWGMCAGFEGVLFPLSGEGSADFFPVVVRRTGLVDPEQMQKDPVLGSTVTNPPLRANLTMLAFTAVPFRQGRTPWEPLKEGEDGPMLNAWGANAGRVLWRLLQAVPGAPPTEMTDELRKQVEKDLRTQAAFDLAYEQSGKITTVEQFNLADANAEPNRILSTGFFARRQLPQDSFHVPGYDVPQALGLPPLQSIDKAFIDAAFGLAPGAEGEGVPLGRVKMPSIRKVLLLKRIGFQPLTREDYLAKYRPGILQAFGPRPIQMSFQAWFTPAIIKQRVKWVPEGGAERLPPTEAPPVEE